MRTVYKYRLEATEVQTLKIHGLKETDSFNEQFLKVDSQKDEAYIWCMVDTDEDEKEVTVRVVATGEPMPTISKDNYLGSFMVYNDTLVFHVFLEK